MKGLARILIRTVAVIAALCFIVAVYSFGKTILPFVRQSEYVEEKCRVDKNISYIIIHNSDCPQCKSHWFKVKGDKYNILLKENAELCTTCFDECETQKLMLLHKLNYRDLYLRYKARYSAEEAASFMEEYKAL